MQNLKILNSKEIKHILEKLEEQFGFEIRKNELEYIFLMNKENKLYILTKDVELINLDELRIDSLGMYFGELYKETIRLSIEGAQLVGKTAKKNIVFLNREQMSEWVKGNDINDFEIKENENKDDEKSNDEIKKGFLIVKYLNEKTDHEDILGCGKLKDGKLLNYISKSRKLIVVNE